MEVLMFGWEFPPHISGGLGTACHGLTKGLIAGGVNIHFVVPRATGDERIELISASDVNMGAAKELERKQAPAVGRSQAMESHAILVTIPVPSGLQPYTTSMAPGKRGTLLDWNYAVGRPGTPPGGIIATSNGFRYAFEGGYGPNLLDEVGRYAEVAAEIARSTSFDVIHAHDWLTFPAGVAAKQASGKPLIVHVHATEYDRGGEKGDRRVMRIEQEGMEAADAVVAVSKWTGRIITSRYRIPPEKIRIVHNGNTPRNGLSFKQIPRVSRHVVTFFGRVTHQKGPQYFVEAARRVLRKFPATHFIVAGSGDLLPHMIEYVAQKKLSSRFHFTGFLRGEQIDQIWSVTSVYVMPSVSEPFGLAALEAIQAGVPAVISKQSGVAEVIPHAVAVDFWDTEALADAIVGILKSKRLSNKLRKSGKEEVQSVTWEEAARQVGRIYEETANG